MKKHLIIIAVALAALSLVPAAFAATTNLTGAKAALADANPDLMAMLTYAIQDERLAQAEYQATIDKLGSGRPFANIIRAEKTHIEYLEDLFDTYKISLPIDNKPTVVAPRDFAAALERPTGRDRQHRHVRPIPVARAVLGRSAGVRAAEGSVAEPPPRLHHEPGAILMSGATAAGVPLGAKARRRSPGVGRCRCCSSSSSRPSR